MFNTAIRDVEDPERVARTACRTDQRKFRVSFKKVAERDSWAANHSTLRPFTSPIGELKVEETLNSTGKSSNIVDMKTIDVLQNDLQSEYREQMGSYLRKKLKNMVGKHQEDVVMHRYLNNTIELGQLSNISHSSVPLDQFYTICNQKSRVKVGKGVQQAYVRHTKQQILRLIQRKRQQQGQYNELNESIKIKRQQKDQRRHKSLKDHFKVPSVEKEGWDLQWRQSLCQEKNRYRDRLMTKNRKDNGGLWLINFDK